jgi:ATP-dependent Clp protease ATP-binding subunit ClpB
MSGYDPTYGARPLRRLVQREIGDRLARALLSGEIADGDTVLVDVADVSVDLEALSGASTGGLSVTRKAPAAQEA